MRVAIVGSRDYDDLDAVTEYVWALPKGTVVVSGGARGVDLAATDAASQHGLETETYSPDWTLGRHAGLERNTLIVQRADRVVAFWDGKSRGTADTIRKARRAGKPVEVFTSDNGS